MYSGGSHAGCVPNAGVGFILSKFTRHDVWTWRLSWAGLDRNPTSVTHNPVVYFPSLMPSFGLTDRMRFETKPRCRDDDDAQAQNARTGLLSNRGIPEMDDEL
ncbi:uncharacterized [Tachysurus ichikawai]